MAEDKLARAMAMDAAQRGGSGDGYTKAEADALLAAKADKTETDTALGGKVDKFPGKGLSANDYTNADKEIVDGVTAALAGKQATLTTAQQNAVDSGITAANVGQYDKDAAMLPEVVDRGAKNYLKINIKSRDIFTSDLENTITVNGTSSGNSFLNLNYVDASTITIPPGDWVVAGFGDMTNLRFRYNENGIGKIVGNYGDPIKFTVPSDGVTQNNIRIENQVAETAFNNVVIKVMLCTKAAWDVSQEFIPYCPTMQELYQRILALENNS